MVEGIRFASLALFAVGPLVAAPALWRRRLAPSAIVDRIPGWRWYVPSLLLPLEWLLPPALIALRIGEFATDWPVLQIVGLAVGLAGAVLLVWACVFLERFLMHEAAIRADQCLIMSGPYRLVRHPVYTGYLAMQLGCGLAAQNIGILLLWPVSLVGIVIQAASEERLLRARFGQAYDHYVAATGRFVLCFWRSSRESICGINDVPRVTITFDAWNEDREMSPTMKDLGIEHLSAEQRVALALEIWESLGDDRPSGQLSAEQRAGLARRDADLEANPGSALSWQQIRGSIEDRR